MREFLAIVNALADANRLRLVMSLSDRELCVCQLVDFIGLADSTVSKHMSVLRDAGLVESRKSGRWVYYRLAGDDASPLNKKALQLTLEQLTNDTVVAADRIRLEDLLSRDDGSQCQTESVSCSTRTLDSVAETE
jgi:DNA-binding transcriptional ArsR family regulator